MGAIEASLAALSAASALAAKVPFISPVAGLLLQALTMRNVSVGLISQGLYLTAMLTGSKAAQGRVGYSHGQT